MTAMAIKTSNLGIRFRLYLEKAYTLKEVLVNVVRRKMAYRDLWALKNVDVDIKRGESVALIGRNGSGKSTLLKIIAGVFEPTEGVCTVNGKVSALIELGAGFNAELTGYENVFLSGAILGRTRAEMKQRLPGIIDFAELHEFMDVAVKNYSSGMYARLGFAIATDVDADILAIDEVLAVGDEAFQKKCTERMNTQLAANKTVVYVSHDMNSVERLCQRGILLHHGVVVYDGPVAQAILEYRKLLASG